MAAIVVVGGGLAGLTCAHRLMRSGHDVEVLESEPEPGGRMRTERHGDWLVERGAQFLTDGSHNLQALVAGLGLSDQLVPLGPVEEAVLRRGRFESMGASGLVGFARSPLLSRPAALRLGRLLLAIALRGRSVDPLRPETTLALDAEDMSSFLLRSVGAEARDYWVGPLVSSTFDADIETLSAGFLLLAARMFAKGRRMQTLRGGLGEITAALSDRLQVRTGCRVFSVESETGGARVRYESDGRERAVVADAAVVAAPGSLVPSLCLKLTPAERGFFESVDYVRGTIVHCMLDALPAPLGRYAGVSFPASSGCGLYGLAVGHHQPEAARAGGGQINAALRESVSQRLWECEDEVLVDFVLAELARTPLGRIAVSQSVVARWPQMLPRFGPGYIRRLDRFRRRSERSPRLAFAGDYLIGPSAECAVISGMRAAAEVVAGLGVPSSGLA